MSYADTYTSLQISFKDLTDTLDKIECVKIISKTIDLQNKTFKVEMAYKDREQTTDIRHQTSE